jgi:hypothetical protein
VCGGVRSEALDYITVLYHFGRYLDTAAQAPLYLCQRARPSHDPQALTHYATTRLRAGVSLRAVRTLLGHENLQATLRCADADTEARRRRGSG